MFKRTGYFNPTGFRRTISSYAPVMPQQAANRFILNYVPSYVPPPPAPEPAPVVDTGGGGDNNVSGPGSYQIGNTGTFKQMNYNDHHSSGIHDGGNNNNNSNDSGDFGDSFNDTSGSFGGGWWNTGGTIPPVYAQRGDFIDAMPGIPEKEINSFQDLTGKLSTMTGIPSNIGTTTQQSTQNFSNVKDATSKGTIASAFDSAKSKAKETIDTAVANPVDTAIDFAIGQALTSELMKAGVKSNPAMALAFGLKQLGNAFYDNKTAYDQAEDPAVPDMPGYSSETPPTGPVTNPADFNFKDYNYGIVELDTPEIDAAINDIANEIDTPTTSSPPSTMSDHANVHGDTSPPSSQPPGIGPGPATPSYDGGFSGPETNEHGDPIGGSSMGPGSGMSGPGDMGGGMQGGANDPAGAGAGMGGYGGSWSRGGHIYASKGGYVNSTGGK